MNKILSAGKQIFLYGIAVMLSACSANEGSGFDPASGPVIESENTLGCAQADNSPNQWIAFRQYIELDTVPESSVARISADSKYWLWINGRLVVFEGCLKRGPNPQDSYYDTVELAPYFKKGKNQVALLLWYFGKNGFSHNGTDYPQLYFQNPHLDSDGWVCRIHPAYATASLLPNPNRRLPESNILFDARKDIPGWQTKNPDSFSPAAVLRSTLGKLHPRPIPQWKDFGVKQIPFNTHYGPKYDTLVAVLPHNMQMTPVLQVEDPDGGHRIIIETDHSKVGPECLRAEYITRRGSNRYESLGWLVGHKIILSVEHGASVNSLMYRETGYYASHDGSFSCSDPFYNRFWEKGLRTIYVNARDTFFDCPDRERAQWWGDLVTILGECVYTYSPSLLLLVRKGILELAGWQRPDGTLFAPVPGSFKAELPCQMLAAVGKYGFWTYYMNTGDIETIREVFPAVKSYLALYTKREDGLMELRRGGWNWGDWGTDKDMNLLQNMWYVLALDGASRMAAALGLVSERDLYLSEMRALQKAINNVCWNGNCYRHPNHEGQTDDRVNALAVLAGVADESKYDDIFGVLKTQEYASPYMEKYVMEALFAIGHGDYALERERKRYGFMVNHPFHDTLFENWNVGIDGDWQCGSVNHAWSGGPLSVIPSMMLGIVPTKPGWKAFSIKPDKFIFDNCSLSFLTVSGEIAFSFDRQKGTMTIKVPERSEASLIYPGEELSRKLGPGKHQIKLKY